MWAFIFNSTSFSFSLIILVQKRRRRAQRCHCSLSREINGVSPATLPHSPYLTQAGYWKFISRDMKFISHQSRVHSFAYFFLHCSVWVKWLFKRYSRHFSTYIGVQKHGESFALNFINIWQLLFLDFLLFRKGIMDTAPGRSTIPDRTSYQPASYFCLSAIPHQLPTKSGSRGTSFMPNSALPISICWLCRVLFVVET